jgi:hypothetical protein
MAWLFYLSAAASLARPAAFSTDSCQRQAHPTAALCNLENLSNSTQYVRFTSRMEEQSTELNSVVV